VDQREQDAWLQALAARVDDGDVIDWVAEERRAGTASLRVVRALRVVAEIAGQARRPTETVQSVPVTEPLPPPTAPPADDEPVSDRYRSYTPSEPAEIRRKLLFGVTLLLALASVYAGLLKWGPLVQYGLAALAVITVMVALISGATGPPRPPDAPAGPSPGPAA